MSVWAIVAYYGDPEAMRATLTSLRSGTVAPAEILVVDNRGDFADPLASVFRPPVNIGFAGAAAEGALRALSGGASWLWFVNDDATVDADCLRLLLEAAASRPRAGMLSPLIRHRDGGDVWFAGGDVDERTFRTSHTQVPPVTTDPYETGYVTGCAMLVSAGLVSECGPPDRSLFMYYEDVEWSLRARARGWRLLVVPEARVSHAVPREGGRRRFSPGAVYYATRNRLLLSRRGGDRFGALPSDLDWALRQTVKSARWGALGTTGLAAFCGLADGLRGRRGAMPDRLLRRLS